MKKKILELKKLNAAYIAALEYDYCPDSGKGLKVMAMFETGVSIETLSESLDENQGTRPDEIAGAISRLILSL